MKIEMMIEGSMVIVGLDKTVIGIEYPKLPKPDEQNPITQKLIAQVNADKNEFVSNMKHIESMIKIGPHYVSYTKNKDLKRYKVLSEIDGGLLCIFSLGFSFGTAVINFEINPSRLTPGKWDELLGLLSVMFNDHYDEIYTKGVLAHAEFCIDVSGEDLSDLVLIDKGRRAYTRFKGTTYLGRRKSHLSTVMYDKSKEQKQEGNLVRIEARLSDRTIRVPDLVETDLFNPFSNCLVVDINQLHSAAIALKNPALPNMIRELGLAGAVANKYARQSILSHLEENAAPWWKPTLYWSAHRELLQQLKPSQIESLTQ